MPGSNAFDTPTVFLIMIPMMMAIKSGLITFCVCKLLPIKAAIATIDARPRPGYDILSSSANVIMCRETLFERQWSCFISSSQP